MKGDNNEEKKFFTRMGDGSPVYMTEAEIRADMREGIDDAVLRGKIDPLSDEDFEKYFGKKCDKKRKVYNGNMKCNFYQYFKR